MRKTNVCMKRPFLIFNIILGIIGGLILALAIFGHGAYHAIEEGDNMVPGLVFFYILGIVVVVVSVLGAYGSRKEKKWALILCCIGASLLCITMMVIAGKVAASKSQVQEAMKAHFEDKKPLDKADEHTQNSLDALQKEFECCGMDKGYQDWGEHIPPSCHCPEYYKNTSKCIEVPKTANVSEEVVYSEPCLPLVVKYVEKAINGMLGILFGFAFFVMIGVVMAVVLLCQMRRQQKPTPMTFSVHSSEPDYKELPEPTENI
ncbi:tetraspanin-8-like [Anguilla anguilla]|uniref:Tetraspanin n=2 Tax=Anguilla anguilla TaxID=7936 RepID=A0A9D3MBV2_ANGAN|nr:tetraspanin-8-like [Anguilla anguilla]KAG5846140.1 hypothetical protein ANANG_G00146630 [Anguilla anguilla]